MQYLKLDGIKLRSTEGVLLGYALVKADGFLYFCPAPIPKDCCWSEGLLREIADVLQEKNREWQGIIDQAFRGDAGSPV